MTTQPLKTEMYAASRAQTGRCQSEDDFVLHRGKFPMCAVADGAGNAHRAAKKALGMFSKLHAEVECRNAVELLQPETWKKWIKLLDTALLGGCQSTFCAFNVGSVMDSSQKTIDIAIGVSVGDTRLYLLNGTSGEMKNVTEGANKARLGSGEADPIAFSVELRPRDLLLLLSDGAYTPMSIAELQKITISAKVKHLSEVPIAIVGRAAKYGGLADDATAVVLRYG
jgi:serine/threonine protein phosphatase PrpC